MRTHAVIALLMGLLSYGCEPGTSLVIPNGGNYHPVEENVLEGSPLAVGVLRFLNDDSTTRSLLDNQVLLNSKAATNLIRQRDGWDKTYGTADDNPFESMEEVALVPYVGPTALLQIQAFAAEWGWIPEEDDYLGTWEGISFTVKEAQATLRFINRCDHITLDIDLGLDKRAADSIVAAQPVLSINHLSNLYYVGNTAIGILKTQGLKIELTDPERALETPDQLTLTPPTME